MLNKIKNLRDKTGAGVVDIKKALVEAGGDEKKALELIRKKGHERAAKKSDRSTHEGVVVSYIHSNGKVGAMIKLYCETDFVAMNEEFKALAVDIAMHVTAMDPKFLKPEDVAASLVEKEREVWTEQLKDEGKPEKILAHILEGKEKKFRDENSLMTQPFVKNPDQTVSELLTEKIAKIGENIQVGGFVRFEL